jgi:hypothetical protein
MPLVPSGRRPLKLRSSPSSQYGYAPRRQLAQVPQWAAALDLGHARPDLLDHPGALVPQHDRPGPGALVHGQVRMAHAAGNDPDERLAGLRRLQLDGLDQGMRGALARHRGFGLHARNVASSGFSD